ncbi:sulfatase-like hydrolase/transferase [Tamlana sp. 2201CG12-4]|uniref:sulfatase family protein n=1 Tax=Tamlana sp. 2201CG12-4 TaxID=3112582 RepID=UPI002DBCC48E|nr:sulfatase-like hydrolase/transferase [Tamlana sp. 2201CG12-4]MEC3908652.1 sulfatase-like hydrolase/transferase [Tamlana sp. 2201CG12-4]
MKKIFLLMPFLFLTLLVQAQEKVEQPNVLIILTDDENTDTVGAYGSDVYTPNIDKIAKNGIKFTNAHVVHTICSPSRYAILTGRYYDNSYSDQYLSDFPEGKVATVANAVTLEKDGLNLVGVLKQNGYTTGFVGKSHVLGHHLMKSNKGWEKGGLQTYPSTADPKTDAATNKKMKANHEFWKDLVKAHGFDYANGVYSGNTRELYNEKSNFHNVEWTGDAAVQFIEEQAKETKPFFLYVGTTYPHGPAPERVVKGNYVVSLDTDPAYTGAGYNHDKDYSKVIANRQALKNDPKNKELSKKSPTATWWDGTVGNIINTLKATGQYENTIIVYMSDHGKLNGGKSSLYQGGTHIPLLIQWPKKIQGDRTFNHVIGSIDITPTILEACQVQKPDNMRIDGKSFFSVLKGAEEAHREALVLKMGYAYALRTDHWNYIAIRYSPEIERNIAQGKDFIGFKKEKIAQPYYILHKQLAQKSFMKNKHYLERNQLFNTELENPEEINLFLKAPKKALEMKALLTKHLKEVNTRPFGEFFGDNPDIFAPASNAIMYPEKESTQNNIKLKKKLKG